MKIRYRLNQLLLRIFASEASEKISVRLCIVIMLTACLYFGTHVALALTR